MITEKSVSESRKEVISYVEKVAPPFDCSILITYNTQTQQLSNWWQFSCHPESWGSKELSDFAWRMADCAAADLKGHAENPLVRQHNVAPRKRIVLVPPEEATQILLGCGIAWPNPEKRAWLILEWVKGKVAVGVEWYETNDMNNGNRFWLVRLILGPIAIRMSRDV